MVLTSARPRTPLERHGLRLVRHVGKQRACSRASAQGQPVDQQRMADAQRQRFAARELRYVGEDVVDREDRPVVRRHQAARAGRLVVGGAPRGLLAHPPQAADRPGSTEERRLPLVRRASQRDRADGERHIAQELPGRADRPRLAVERLDHARVVELVDLRVQVVGDYAQRAALKPIAVQLDEPAGRSAAERRRSAVVTQDAARGVERRRPAREHEPGDDAWPRLLQRRPQRVQFGLGIPARHQGDLQRTVPLGGPLSAACQPGSPRCNWTRRCPGRRAAVLADCAPAPNPTRGQRGEGINADGHRRRIASLSRRRGRAAQRDPHGLLHALAGPQLVWPWQRERAGVRLVGGVGPVALVLHLEGVTFEAHLGADAGRDLVRDRPQVHERLVRGDEQGETPVLDRAVRVLDRAGPAGALRDRVQNAEAGAGCPERRARAAVHREGDRAIAFAGDGATPREGDGALDVLAGEADAERVRLLRDSKVVDPVRHGAPRGVAHGGVDSTDDLAATQTDVADAAFLVDQRERPGAQLAALGQRPVLAVAQDIGG